MRVTRPLLKTKKHMEALTLAVQTPSGPVSPL